MRINKKDPYVFGGTFIKYSLGASEFEVNSTWGNSSLLPFIGSIKYKYKPLNVTLLIEADDRQELEKNKSELVKIIGEECWVDFEDSTFEYKSVLKSINYKDLTQTAAEVELEFKCLQFEREISLNLDKQVVQTLMIKGTGSSECKLIIIPTTDISIFTINDITIKELKLGKRYIVDGIKKLVSVDGINAFKQVELTSFPRVKVGANEMKMSTNKVNVELVYRPYFI